MIQFKSDIAIYQQVAMYFEQKIRNGELVAGDRLPTTMELSKQLGVNRETVQLGLKLLTNQGLISRSPKRGTFVREYAPNQVLGIVLPQNVYSDPDLAFFPVYYSCLAQYAAHLGWQSRYFITTPDNRIDNGFYDLRKAADAGELGGIIDVSSKSSAVGIYLRRECPVPQVVNPQVDFRQMIELGLARLRESSYSRIDVFFPIRYDDPAASHAQAEAILDHLYQTGKADRQLLRLHILPTRYEDVFNGFIRIWKEQSSPPEAILLASDALFCGIWNAALKLKIDIPGKLGLITHANQRLIPKTHIPLTMLEIPTDQMVRTAFDTFLARRRGENVHIREITSCLVEGETCRPVSTRQKLNRRKINLNA